MRFKHVMIVSALFCAGAAHAQGWSPQRNVEMLVGFVPGGGVDRTARTVERTLLANKLVNSGISVINKPGGGTSVAYNYLSQRPADGHSLMFFGQGLLTNHLRGSSPLTYTDFTLIATLFNEFTVFAVNAASPIRTGKDLVERLKKDPKSVTIGFASIGGASHLSAALFNKTIGGSARDLKVVAFKGTADAITNLLGGHIDLAVFPVSSAGIHVAAGTMRLVGAAAPQRFGGALANVPTWKEQGVDMVYGTWRAVMGPKGMGAAQVAFWENALRKVTETAEWKTDLENNFWLDDFITGARFRKEVEKDYANLKAVLMDVGLVSQ